MSIAPTLRQSSASAVKRTKNINADRSPPQCGTQEKFMIVLVLAFVAVTLWADALAPFVKFVAVMGAVPVGMCVVAAVILGATVRS